MSTLYIDTPEVRAIVARAFPEYSGRRYRVEVFHGPMRLDSYWSGGSRDYYTAVRLTDGARDYVPENGTPFTKEIGQLEQLPENTALVQWHRGPHEYICVYMRPDNMNSMMLPAPVELTVLEKIVLAATCGLKSHARFQEANRETGINLAQWDEGKASLIARGLLNKAGAVTDAGRNALGGLGSQMLRNLKAPDTRVPFAINKANKTAVLLVGFNCWEEVQGAFRCGILMPDGTSATGIGRSASAEDFSAKAKVGGWTILQADDKKTAEIIKANDGYVVGEKPANPNAGVVSAYPAGRWSK